MDGHGCDFRHRSHDPSSQKPKIALSHAVVSKDVRRKENRSPPPYLQNKHGGEDRGNERTASAEAADRGRTAVRGTASRGSSGNGLNTESGAGDDLG